MAEPADVQGGAAGDIGYADALAELDQILAELDGVDVDVDRLADRVERAQVLITLCRERIGAAHARVAEIVGSDGDATGAPGQA